jgi:hypothetical protein
MNDDSRDADSPETVPPATIAATVSPEPTTESTRTDAEPTATTHSSTTEPMTHDTTDTDDTTTSTTNEPTGTTDGSPVPFPPECRQTMKDMDHSSPVDGPNRTFERGTSSDAKE